VSIYVEIRIRGDVDTLWRLTQEPASHQRWDLRFSEIDYLPRLTERDPQRFRYATRIGFGLRVRGEGESTGHRDGAAGERTSALRFWSDDAKSLIREGSGYWRYVPTAEGVRFLTWYDYRTRFGIAGRVVDALVFRPLMGWATAWSFDRLRLWIERGIEPAHARQRWLAHAVARLTVAAIFVYHGLVPKLLYRAGSELAMLTNAGVAPTTALRATLLAGVAEVAFGTLLVVAWRARWPLAVAMALMPVALVGVAAYSPRMLVEAFNPVTLNLAVVALAAVAWLTHDDLPSAARCLRTRPAEER